MNLTLQAQLKQFLNKIRNPVCPVKVELLSPTHLGQLNSAVRAPEINQYLQSINGVADDPNGFVESIVTEKNCINFAVLDSRTNQVIGLSRLKKVDDLSKKAEIETWLTPEKQNRGFNYFIKRDVLAVAFKFLEIDVIYCFVASENIAAVKSLVRIGFRYNRGLDRVVTNKLDCEVELRYLSINLKGYKMAFCRRLKMVS